MFGFGGESFTVANSALLADWFKGKELAFAFGINLSISKLGSVINNILSPALANSVGIIFALWFGAILCGVGVLCVLITMPIDRAMDARIKKAKQGSDESENKRLLEQEGNTSNNTLKDAFSLKHIFWILVVSCVVVYGCVLPFNNISSSLLLERDYFIPNPSDCSLQNPYQCEDDQNQPMSSCPSSKWYQPPLPYNYSTYNPLSTDDIDCTDDLWKDGCTEEYCSRLTTAESRASVIMSIPYIISAVLSPPVGYLVDLYGYRAVIATIAPAILIVVHLLLGLTSVNPIGPLVGQGLAYTGFVSVLWPSVPLVVEERLTGLAFGIVTSMQNLACAVIPLIVASIYSSSGDAYIPNVEMLFVILAAVGFVVGIYMNYYDYNNDGILNKPFQSSEEALAADEKNEPLLNPIHDDDQVNEQQDWNARTQSSDLQQRRSVSRGSFSQQKRTQSRGGSFSAHEEIARSGAYYTR